MKGPVVHGVRPPRRVVKRAVRRSKKATPTAPSAVDLDDDRSTEKCKYAAPTDIYRFRFPQLKKEFLFRFEF